MMMSFSMSTGTNDAGRRLDRLLRKALPALPLSAVHRLLRKGAVLVNGAAQSADFRVKAEDVITVNSLPADSAPSPSGLTAGRKASVPPAPRDLSAEGADSSAPSDFLVERETPAGNVPSAVKPPAPASREISSAAPEPPALFSPRELSPSTGNVSVSGRFSPPAAAPPHTAGRLRPPSPFPPPLEILFEGNGLLFLNKPAGLQVHGRNSLEDLVLAYLAPDLPPSLSFRPGPLHRLDRPTSGVIAFSSSIAGARFFSEFMRERKIKKFYLALVEGNIGKNEVWQDDLARDGGRKKTFVPRPGESRGQTVQKEQKEAAGTAESKSGVRPALTRVKPLEGNGSVTLILAEIETGRTHQIRAQAAERGHPLLGDKKYGGKPLSSPGFYLHAWRVKLPEALPCPSVVEAPLPENFRKKIRELFGRAFSAIISNESI